MDREKLIASGINYDMGLKRFAGKVPLYEKYLRQFIEDPNFPKLQEEMEREDYEEAFKTAHALKGVIGTLSMDKLFAAVCELVEALRVKDADSSKELMLRAEQEYGDTIQILKESCGE